MCPLDRATTPWWDGYDEEWNEQAMDAEDNEGDVSDDYEASRKEIGEDGSKFHHCLCRSFHSINWTKLPLKYEIECSHFPRWLLDNENHKDEETFSSAWNSPIRREFFLFRSIGRWPRIGNFLRMMFCETQPSSIHWLSSPIFPCLSSSSVRPALVTSPLISTI